MVPAFISNHSAELDWFPPLCQTTTGRTLAGFGYGGGEGKDLFFAVVSTPGNFSLSLSLSIAFMQKILYLT